MRDRASRPAVLRVEADAALVIGDIHGCVDALRRLLERAGRRTVVVVGDVGDRGPDTAGVIECLAAAGAVGVMGNHDEWLVAWASGEGFDTAALQRSMGGEATLRSYGVTGRTAREVESQRLRVPPAHRRWLAGLACAIDLHVAGQPWWVVHAAIPRDANPAGLAPERLIPELAARRPGALRWSETDAGALPALDRPVIVGHQPRSAPLDLGHVIALDTGAGTRADGTLTGLLLPERRFLSEPAPPVER